VFISAKEKREILKRIEALESRFKHISALALKKTVHPEEAPWGFRKNGQPRTKPGRPTLKAKP